MTKDIEKIQKLLALARDREGTIEGDSVRRLVMRKLEKLGLTEADIEVIEEVVLHAGRSLWESSLLDTVCTLFDCDLLERVDETQGTDQLVVRASRDVFDKTLYRFQALQSGIKRLSVNYEASIRGIVAPVDLYDFTDVFRCYAVLALSHRMLELELDKSLVHEEEEEEFDAALSLLPPDLLTDDGVDTGDPTEELLEYTEEVTERDFGVPAALDPSIAGYSAGGKMAIPELTQKPSRSTHKMLTDTVPRIMHHPLPRGS